MTTDMTEQWNNIAKTAMNSVQELGQINVRVIEQLTQQQLAVLNTWLETSQKEIDIASEKKDPQELMKLQAELMSEYNNKLMEIVKNTGNILSSCNSEITAWAEKNVEAAGKTGK